MDSILTKLLNRIRELRDRYKVAEETSQHSDRKIECAAKVSVLEQLLDEVALMRKDKPTIDGVDNDVGC